MHSALETYLPGYATSVSEGGTCFWLVGPQNLDTASLESRLRPRRALLDNGPIFFADPAMGQGRFRIGFALWR